MIPDKAFILAAGHGKRMRPLTERTPKPLVEVHGRPILDHTLSHLQRIGAKEVIINAHHLAPQIQDWAKTRSSSKTKIYCITEPELLDTGGGVVNALNHFDDTPFYVIAGDAFWIDAPGQNTLTHLAQNWRDTMDILMILQDIKTMTLTTGIGDYDLQEDGCAVRSMTQSGTAMFTNVRINHPRIFKDRKPVPFSFLEIMDNCEKNKTLYGLMNKGTWHHISTPQDLERVNEQKEE